jgi:hypothetical protein
MRKLLCALLVLAGSAQANIGRIKSSGGSVVILRGTQQIAVVPGVVLEAGDTLSTKAKGRIGVTFVDNSRIALSSNSELNIEKFDFDDTTHAGTFILNLKKGSMSVVSGQISRNGSKSMLIRTPKSLFALRDAKMLVKIK